ncbi:MAG TPA: lipocalin family protein [Gemmatales bacterium]|nr:lipocalin family protein [Gemmatales bacterium]
MFVIRMFVPVLLLCLTAHTSLSAAPVPDQNQIVGKWTMSSKDDDYSFVHHMEFKSNGVLIADEETVINGKKTVYHGQGTWKVNGKRLTVATGDKGQQGSVETVNFKLTGDQLEISDGKETIVFQRVK